MPMNLAVTMILIFLVSFVFAFVMRAAAISVYKNTGVDMLSRLHKAVWYVQVVGLVLMAVFGLEPWMMIVLVVVMAALHVLLGRKAGAGIAVVMGILEAIGGMMAAALIILMWILNLAMKISDMGSGSFPDLNGAFSIGSEVVFVKEQLPAPADQEETVSQREEQP
ncbi:MAG: hypothetical protein IJP02_06345 [Oscillospiraceae bacterium]|nr:hypothetical protein [Oscillospiraceae bacterium]